MKNVQANIAGNRNPQSTLDIEQKITSLPLSAENARAIQ